ncbi:hypothetical protein T484DRAFT_1916761, partial [Baffinella frigidus]
MGSEACGGLWLHLAASLYRALSLLRANPAAVHVREGGREWGEGEGDRVEEEAERELVALVAVASLRCAERHHASSGSATSGAPSAGARGAGTIGGRLPAPLARATRITRTPSGGSVHRSLSGGESSPGDPVGR